MKKNFLFLALVALLAACTPNEPVIIDPVEQQVAFCDADTFEAVGINTVTKSQFSRENTRAEVVIVSDTTLNINIYDIKFAQLMPVTIDMVIAGVSYTRTDSLISFAGDSIVPTAGNKGYEKYIVRSLSGTLTADSLSFDNKYGDHDTEYRGRIVFLH